MDHRVAWVGVGIIAAMGVAGAALAAVITTSQSNAGQGNTIVAGYTVGTILFNGGWVDTDTNDSNTDVTDFSFVIKRDSDGTGSSTVTDGNTTVYAQLKTPQGNGNWILCEVSDEPEAGSTLCVADEMQTKPLGEVTGVNIAAYDK